MNSEEEIKVGDLVMLCDRRTLENNEWIIDHHGDWVGPMLLIGRTDEYWMVPGWPCWIALHEGKRITIPDQSIQNGHVQVVILDPKL